jgi:4-diphosphocytidyl-2C-methyl-D-erythritol kinase
MLNEVKKNPHVEVLPKEMYKKYSDYRNSRQEEQRKPKKRKTIDVTSDEDSQDIRNELEDTVHHQIDKLKRKKLRLEAGLEAMDSYKQKEKMK